MDSNVLTPDFVPEEWTNDAGALCSCPVPLPEVRATRKGAARTYCARCGLPTRITFGER
jgi:hypothetical protein